MKQTSFYMLFCIYRIDYILQKTHFVMGLVLLVSQCSLPGIESILVSIKISPGLLEEFPDHCDFTQVKAHWHKCFCGCKSPIGQGAISWKQRWSMYCTVERYICMIFSVAPQHLNWIQFAMKSWKKQAYVAWVFNKCLSRVVLTPPGLDYKSVTSASRDHGNISHDPTRDSSHDPSATRTSRDLSAHDPGNLRPCDPGKIIHDLARNLSSTMSPNQTRFGHTSNPLINTWQIVGTSNKIRPLNNQQTCNANQSMKTRLIRARP